MSRKMVIGQKQSAGERGTMIVAADHRQHRPSGSLLSRRVVNKVSGLPSKTYSSARARSWLERQQRRAAVKRWVPSLSRPVSYPGTVRLCRCGDDPR
jgi:hypothetical protein